MGNCIPPKQSQQQSKTRLKPQTEAALISKLSIKQQQYGIKDDKPTKSIHFNHAPLMNNQYLYNKFHHDSNRPDQINLQWQIESIKIQNDKLSINVLNLIPVKIWVIIGGKQMKNMTGLYIDIQKYIYCQQITINTICYNEKSNMYQFCIPKQINDQKIRIICESITDSKQSLCLISTYIQINTNIKLQKQQLLWNNLAFNLQTIYNQDQQQLNQKAKSQYLCVICNQLPPTCILIPCKHMCLCRNCLSNFRKIYKQCPLCKKQFNQIVVYKDVNN